MSRLCAEFTHKLTKTNCMTGRRDRGTERGQRDQGSVSVTDPGKREMLQKSPIIPSHSSTTLCSVVYKEILPDGLQTDPANLLIILFFVLFFF